MPTGRRSGPATLALALLLGVVPCAGAAPLLHADGGRATLRGVPRLRTLTLASPALADLRGRTHAVVESFPLGGERTVTLELTRFQPFTARARVEVMDAGAVRTLPLPDNVYFHGTVRGDPRSRVLLVAGRDTVRGWAATGGTVYPFGPDAHGVHRSYALRDADPTAWPPPGDFCANDLHPGEVDAPAATARALADAGLAGAPAPLPGATLLEAQVAIETDYELRRKFPSDQATLDYLASLAAAASAIYERDVSVRLRFSYVRLWSTASDPWSATSTLGALDEVRGWWTNAANGMTTIAGPRDVVHFVSGKSVSGGIAYVGAVCNQQYGFGVSQVYGSFDLATPSQIWDVLVVAHELGHNLGSPHTHCYDPPVDRCYNRDTSCYAGQVVASRGTVMSYCHLLSGGLTNIDLAFGDTVSARIRSTVTAAACLAPATSCGDGTLDASEECDDGNVAAGDGCSAQCRTEVCGNGVLDPGEECDDGNAADADGCSAACAREAGCADGVLDPGEECDDGNVASGDGCSPGCTREPRCGDAVVDPGEQCDDGNTTRGDGCSHRCKDERCKVATPGQTLWARPRVALARGNGGDRLQVRGEFAIPRPFAQLAPAESGLLLRLEDVTGEHELEIALPGGAAWRPRRHGWAYVDGTGAVNGVRKVLLTDRTRGDLPELAVVVSGRGGTYPFGPADLPLAVTVVLGDEAAGAAGACGRYGFGGGACAARGHGARLVCR